jgi:hypothetical protein
MRKTFNIPQYRAVFYRFNPETGYYTKTEQQASKTPLMRLPFELRSEQTRAAQIKNNAGEVLVSRERSKTGSYKFMTGLQKTGIENWYLGNDYEMKAGVKIISLILFHFTEDFSKLTVYYFPGFDKRNTAMRLRFTREIIPHLINTKGRPEPPFNAFNLAIQPGEPVCNDLGKNKTLP